MAKTLSEEIKNYSPAAIEEYVHKLSKEVDRAWNEKLKAMLTYLENKDQLESMGRALNKEQAEYLFNLCTKDEKSFASKFSPLLVGLSSAIFASLLLTLPETVLNMLKHQGFSEPLQHHLTQQTHEWLHEISKRENALLDLEKEIATLEVETLSYPDIEELEKKIESLYTFYNDLTYSVNRALALSWNTNRVDLIEKLTKIKNLSLKILRETIGLPEPASGYYLKLEDKIHSIYGNPENPEDHEALYDDEPVIEALSKFDIWYISDYTQLGLTSKKKKRGERLLEVQKKLEQMGLKNVGDLKRVRICSKNTLKEYLHLN